MQVKVFSATKLHEALALVRHEFGPDAVIMDRLEGVDGGGKRVWHVHAALDDERLHDNERGILTSQAKKHQKTHRDKEHKVDTTEIFKASMKRLERIVEGLGRQESASLREALTDQESREAFDHLVQLGVAPTHAFDMAEDFVERHPVSASVLHWSERIIPHKKSESLLFIGPCGAGKTTLIAKLATHYSLKGVPVAILSTDTNRMGGTDTLKSYADILGVPFYTIRSDADIDRALEATKSAQLLLVDSEGWTIRRAGGVRKQRLLWDEIPATHRVLVLPVNMDEMDGMEMLAKAGTLEVNQLAITKLDETARPGKVVNWAAAFGIPLSYCSFGPEVPEQMGWLTPQALTSILSSQEMKYAKETA